MKSTQVSPRDLYGLHADPGNGLVKTTGELFSDRHFQQAAEVCGATCDDPVPDWRLIRAAKANAREIGMRASVPDPAAGGTLEYAADLAQWGDGRGIGPGSSGLPGEPDGPEAGG